MFAPCPPAGGARRRVARAAHSCYERVLIRAISGRRLLLQGEWYTPVGMKGWSSVIFRREANGARVTIPVDALIAHLEAW